MSETEKHTQKIIKNWKISYDSAVVASKYIPLNKYIENRKLEAKEKFKPKVFPNPSTNTISIENLKNEDYSIRFYTVSGVEVSGQVFKISTNNENGSHKFDISSLIEGVYSIQIMNSTNVYYLKLIYCRPTTHYYKKYYS